MFDALPAANLGLEWEPCHQMVNLIDPIPQLRRWVPKIFHVHGKDATVAWDLIREKGINGPEPFAWHRTPGFGDSNWRDIITILRQNDYQGTIDIEGYHDPVYCGELEWTGQISGLNYLKTCRGGALFQKSAMTAGAVSGFPANPPLTAGAASGFLPNFTGCRLRSSRRPNPAVPCRFWS